MIRFFKQKPVRMGICYPASLALVTLACFWLIGTRDILVSAMTSRPYAVLFDDYHFSGLLREYREKNLVEDSQVKRVLFLGDSAAFFPPDTIFPRDINSAIHLSGLLLDSISSREQGINLKMSDWSYIGATLFDRYCLYYQARKYQPDLIIVSIHWISFGSPWQDNPDFFRLELSALVPLRSELPKDYKDPLYSAGITIMKQIEHKLSIYSLYPIGARNWIRGSLWDILGGEIRSTASAEDPPEGEPAIPDASPGIPQSGNSTGPRKKSTMSPEGYSKNYPMKIEPSHPALANIRALSYVASKHKTKVLFYLWPVDLDHFKEIGIHDPAEFEKSRLRIRDAARGEGIFFVDLSTLLGHEYVFDWQGHFTVEGRRKIAEALAPKVLEILGENDSVAVDKPATSRGSGP